MGVIDRSNTIHRLASKLRQYARVSLGRILGTISAEDGRYKWFVDNQERSLFLRAELNALVGLLHAKGVITVDDWQATLEKEFELYAADLAKEWPEVGVAEDGRSFTIDVEKLAARSRREGWPP